MSLADKHVLLSLSASRATANVGWHKRAGLAYSDSYIGEIEDPSNAAPTRILTAIPSPFARIHLFDAAFAFVNRFPKAQIAGAAAKQAPHEGTTAFHQMVSDCFDVLQMLFMLVDQATPVKISDWSSHSNLESLKSSDHDGQKLLRDTLLLYLREDGHAVEPGQQVVLHQLTVSHRIFAISSPLTLFITAPEARETAVANKLINPVTDKAYFTDISPLHTRDDSFQLYVHSLFGGTKLSTLCRRMNEYLAESLKILDKTRKELADKIRAQGVKGVAGDLQSLTAITYEDNLPLEVLGVPLLKRPSLMVPQLRVSPIALKSSRQPDLARPPIVWSGKTNSLGVKLAVEQQDFLSPVEKLEERVLPDLNITYPFLCAGNFIEDRIVRVPFAINEAQFCVPVNANFEAGLEFGYLLPLKKEFFDYFEPRDIFGMATFTRMSDGVEFELRIPTLGQRTVTFTKTYYASPQRPKDGKIISAGMNLALYPFLSITGERPEEKACRNRYWVMLIDTERDPVQRDRVCFDLTFFHATSKGVQTFIAGQPKAELTVATTPRSNKSVDAGSTFYELRGGPCDFIQMESFGFDAGRKTSAMIVPKWPTRSLGTREARVAIDFGTTNTHMAIRIDDGLPEPFHIDQDELQLALLNAPDRSRATPDERYDGFPGKDLVGTGIRAHHEFLPSIIGEGSRFHFPLRTATSEPPNLKFGDFHTLRTVNISFIYGVEAPHSEEVIKTNLKWSLQADPEMVERVKSFIEELLFLLRTKLLTHDVDPAKLSLTWFRPLSFNMYTKDQFEQIWVEKAAEVLGMPKERVNSLTESEAPFYYHVDAHNIITSKPTVCVDIGGGSTDMVFFEDHVPRFGTSFSFAGNALWGTGYDRLGIRESGIVARLDDTIKSRMLDAIERAPRGDTAGQKSEQRATAERVKAAYDSLRKNRSPSQEIINFCFAMDSEIHFIDLLKISEVKCLVLLHYSAIVYHCAQLMKAQKMQAPEYLCFSGRGSQYLKILDVSPKKLSVARHTQQIFEYVYGVTLKEPIKILTAEKAKEATCNGGILKKTDLADAGTALNEHTPTPKPLVAVGDGGSPPETVMTYADVNDGLKAAVAGNLSAFVDMMKTLSVTPGLRFKDTFNIDYNADLIEKTLKSKLEESIGFGLSQYNPTRKNEDEISETLFFYPLIQNLYELGNHLLPHTEA